ncbi:MAG: hypothetical protein WDM88_01890 [Galbitalea sp.]
MYWSGYDTSILITGILTLVLAVVPGIGVANQTRGVIGAVGAGLIIISIITGNLQSLVYPSIVTIAPVIPVVAGVIMVIRARNLAAAERQSVDVSAPAIRATTSSAAVPASAVLATSSSTEDLSAQAADPTTPLATLADLAYDHPELRPAIAANPSTYPDLLEWLGGLDDPAVAKALASRTSAD